MSQDSRQAFVSLVGPHFDALYRAALRLTRRPADAEDLVQEVCLRAFAEATTLCDLEYVLGWLLRVQYRVFIDGDRRRRRAPFVKDASADDLIERACADGPGPEDLALSAIEHEALDIAWSRLGPDQQALLALHAEGYGLAELERITGTNKNAVSARLHRARRRLAKLLNDSRSGSESMTSTVTKHGM